MIIIVAMLLCHCVQRISYTLHVFMFYKHMKVLLKGYGFLCVFVKSNLAIKTSRRKEQSGDHR